MGGFKQVGGGGKVGYLIICKGFFGGKKCESYEEQFMIIAKR
jgi:hypothetical protein